MKQILNGPATSKLFHTLKTLKHRLRLRKTRVIDLTTKHSIDQPLQKWEWPKGTWLQNRMKSMRNMKDPTYDTPRKRSNVDGQGRSSRKSGPSLGRKMTDEDRKQPTIFD
jgi:hypothetical protein